MSCFFPLYGYFSKVYDLKDNKEKRKLNIIGSIDRANDFLKNSNYDINIKSLDDLCQVPCGQCIGCRLGYSAYWANRLTAECEFHKYNYFITLTYNDENLPEYGSLVKKHLQNFFKRFRKFIDQHNLNYSLNYGLSNTAGIRYYACGEYGSQYQRPHYHIILFSDIDLKPFLKFQKNIRGNNYYTCDIIDKIWTNANKESMGFNIVSEVSWSTCAYVARYMMKKLKGPTSEKFYKDKHIISEFSLMSRKPGIAENYFNNNYDNIYKVDGYIIKKGSESRVVKPGKYFDNKLKNLDEDLLNIVKEKRRTAAIENMKRLRSETGLSDKEIIKNKYIKFCSKTQKLNERSFNEKL